MIRKFNRSDKLVIASHNQGKVREIRALLEPLHIEVVGAGELDLIEQAQSSTSLLIHDVVNELAFKFDLEFAKRLLHQVKVIYLGLLISSTKPHKERVEKCNRQE